MAIIMFVDGVFFVREICCLVLKHIKLLQVLVHGSAEATEYLKLHCAKNSDFHVYAPQIEETIDVTSDLCAYKVCNWNTFF